MNFFGEHLMKVCKSMNKSMKIWESPSLHFKMQTLQTPCLWVTDSDSSVWVVTDPYPSVLWVTDPAPSVWWVTDPAPSVWWVTELAPRVWWVTDPDPIV